MLAVLRLVALASLAYASKFPTVTIAPGVDLPMVGLGTWQYNSSRAETAVALALELGYPHIDTALGYGNQEGIAKAIAKVPRTSYFLTSKIPGGFDYKNATAALEQSLAQLGVEYVDLMLVHYPATWGGTGGAASRQAEWKALEDFHKSGKARAIGVSHYCHQHLEDILAIATVKPAVNQVQYHVGMGSAGPNATDDRVFDQSHGIVYESFSPLCGPCGDSSLINGPLVTGIGKKYGKTGAQVSLRWQTQQGIPIIPKTDSKQHLLENLDVFDWDLTSDEMKALTAATSPQVFGPGDGTSGDCVIA